MSISNKKITINGDRFSDLEGFYEEISEKLMKNQDWKIGTLDGLDDILYGGFGVFEPKEKVMIIWKNSEKSKANLGFQATLQFLENKLRIGKPYNIKLISEQKENLISGKGKTLFEIILEIFESHPEIYLTLD